MYTFHCHFVYFFSYVLVIIIYISTSCCKIQRVFPTLTAMKLLDPVTFQILSRSLHKPFQTMVKGEPDFYVFSAYFFSIFCVRFIFTVPVRTRIWLATSCMHFLVFIISIMLTQPTLHFAHRYRVFPSILSKRLSSH